MKNRGAFTCSLMCDCYFLAFFGFFFSRFGAFLFAMRIVCHGLLRLTSGNESFVPDFTES
jgi:hypothetical protein